MALSATTIFEVRSDGSDTLNGGVFDPGQTAGMFGDGAATSATTASPVFTSASYNFVAGDVGAWIYIASGSNWTAGWYQIASVAANVATLSAAIGAGVLKTKYTPTTAAGCATTGSPTAATWTIDYSQQAAAQFAYTDLASVGAGLTVSSAAKPFAKQQVGNSIVITGGTNFTTGRYVIASVAAAVATVIGPGNITTGAGASGTGGQGGAFASIGKVVPVKVGSSGNNSNTVFVRSGSYSITTASTNVANGCVLDTSTGDTRWEGYGSVRGDMGTAPVMTASGISTFVMFTQLPSNLVSMARNLTVDGAGLTSSRGFSINTGIYDRLTAKNCTNNGILGASDSKIYKSIATGCSVNPAFRGGVWTECVAYANTNIGFQLTSGSSAIRCLSYLNTGANSSGFDVSSQCMFNQCVAYGNGKDGFTGNLTGPVIFYGCIAEGNGGWGWSLRSTTPPPALYSCAGYNNTSGPVAITTTINIDFVTGTGSFFTNASSGDFSLNNTAGAGAALRGLATVLPVGLTTSYHDIGAAQHADPVSAAHHPIIGGSIVRAM